MVVMVLMVELDCNGNTLEKMSAKIMSTNHSDKKTLLQFVQKLPYGTNIRHHIVGDVGKENKLAVQNKKIVNK